MTRHTRLYAVLVSGLPMVAVQAWVQNDAAIAMFQALRRSAVKSVSSSVLNMWPQTLPSSSAPIQTPGCRPYNARDQEDGGPKPDDGGGHD